MSRLPRRIKVDTESRVRVHTDEVPVTILGLSARDVLVLAARPLGVPGDIVEVYLPAVGRREIEVTGGVTHTAQVERGFAVVIEFMVVEPRVRVAINDLLRLLLAGEGGGERRHPRVIYDVPVRWGPAGEYHGRLEEISFGGLTLYVNEALAPGDAVRVAVPDHGSAANLMLDGHVVDQLAGSEAGFRTGVQLLPVTGALRGALARLMADLLCR
jgi:hypothetical protein